MKTNNNLSTILHFLNQKKIIFISYIIVTLAVSIIQYSRGEKKLGEGIYTEINNYIIFKQSYFHLITDKDPYIAYPLEHWDIYKYSPAFALNMGVLAYLPDLLSLTLWNLANSLLLFFALSKIRFFDDKKKSLLLWLVLPELIINLQNSQSNSIIAGLMIITYNLLEQRKTSLAALTAVLGFFIKIYGAGICLIFLFYPNKIRFIVFSILYFILLLLIPLVAVSPEQLLIVYKSWLNILQYDANTAIGLSVMGWLQTWFNFEPQKGIVLLIGLIILLIPLLKRHFFTEEKFRITYLSALLLWVIIFNHKSESPTFIIAMAGAGIWYLSSAMTKSYTVIFIIAFIFSSLSPTDIFPVFLRNKYVIPYVLKVVPLILVWLVLMYELISKKKQAPVTN